MTPQTYAEMLKAGAQKLREAGLEDPRRDARQLMLLATDLSSAGLIAAELGKVTPAHRDRFEHFITARIARTPIAHISGSAPFYGLELKSDARALIPRPDSEVVVDLALRVIPEGTKVTVADLGTGTGALLAALLANRPRARGVAVEASPDAMHLAAENFDALGFASRIERFQGSWVDWKGWADCDLIISNPPYIRRDVIPGLEPEVRDHDPMQALDGGEEGLDAYREIIALGKQHMKPGAHLVFEIGFDQKAAVSGLLIEAGYTDLQHRRDYGGNDRAIAATKT